MLSHKSNSNVFVLSAKSVKAESNRHTQPFLSIFENPSINKRKKDLQSSGTALSKELQTNQNFQLAVGCV